MWQRVKRFFRSLFGGMLESVENPELILKQAIRDMRDQVPKMNANLAKMKGGMLLLEREYNDYLEQERGLTARVKAALEAGDEALAADYAIRLKRAQEGKAKTFEQLSRGNEAYEKAVEFKQDFMRQMDRKIREAESAMREHESSKWKAEVAQVFESFEIADTDSTMDEMLQKLRQKTAMSEGKLAMAMETVDMRDIQMEKRAEQIEAQELLRQFKVEWGMENADLQSTPAEKTVGPAQTEGQG